MRYLVITLKQHIPLGTPSLELHLSVSVIVKFPNKKPLYVALNKTLVLEADFQLQESEKVLLQTWERKNGDGEIRVAESGRGNNKRISVEKNGALLKITGVTESDYGVYRFTVTVNNGYQVSDSRKVLKIINPPNASLYMQCSIPSVDAQWDKPAFLWQVNGITIANRNEEISADGSTLHLTNLDQNYTCITESSQGTSKVEVRINASMDLGAKCFWASILLHAFVLQICSCISVRFLSQKTIYVVNGETLVLQAEFEVPVEDHITKVTWEHEPEGKKNSGKTLLAEYPAKSSGGRAILDKSGSVITLRNYQRSDNGVYTVTVRDHKGGQSSAHCTVHEYDAVHHVSVMVNVTHSSLHCMEAWGTEPVFRWLHEKAAVTEAVGRVSDDGTSLYLNSAPCGHYTCMVSNKLGHSSATYTAVPCERERSGTAVAVICLVLLLLLTGGLAFLLWRDKRYALKVSWSSASRAVDRHERRSILSRLKELHRSCMSLSPLCKKRTNGRRRDLGLMTRRWYRAASRQIGTVFIVLDWRSRTLDELYIFTRGDLHKCKTEHRIPPRETRRILGNWFSKKKSALQRRI
ncbi:vascular endothelial growth factor receptor 1 [Silurus asotus]|uniref:Vascular endothelial growth factor receptor 1 n=1 Tax=Silurus asotus TaxID=30991 RepID=A0AAD5FDX0_SILAS|nr:vascular endothelial growth factor receptor 1 [Silurus asotus]